MPSPPPSVTATWTALPTVPAVQPPTGAGGQPSESATQRPTVAASPTPRPTASVTASASPTASPLPTASNTPVPPTLTLSPTAVPTPAENPTPVATTVLTKDLLHILLIGGDRHYIPDQNTDVLIVAVLDRKNGQGSLLSIPRDLWVYIPTYGWSRINVAHKIGERTEYPGGGPGLLKRTIEMNFGIPIDYWGRLDYQGFTQVVDRLGGVDMIVPCRVNLRYKPPTSAEEEELVLDPGIYHMDGYTALRYVRTRRDTSDFDRARRQHQFLKALWDQAKSRGILPKIPGLWAALHDSFETDMNLLDALSLAPMALEIRPQRVRSRYIGAGQVKNWINADGWQVLLPDYDKIQEVVASLYAPPAASEEQAAGEAARIQVRNGTMRPQLAIIAADQLRWHGLNVVDTGPANQTEAKKTQIVVFTDKPKAVGVLAQLLQVKPENVVHQPDPSQPADIQVVLGEDYDPCR